MDCLRIDILELFGISSRSRAGDLANLFAMPIKRFLFFITVLIAACAGGLCGDLEVAHHEEEHSLIYQNVTGHNQGMSHICKNRRLKLFAIQSGITPGQSAEAISLRLPARGSDTLHVKLRTLLI